MRLAAGASHGLVGGAHNTPSDPLAVFGGEGRAPGKGRGMGRGKGRGNRRGEGEKGGGEKWEKGEREEGKGGGEKEVCPSNYYRCPPTF